MPGKAQTGSSHGFGGQIFALGCSAVRGSCAAKQSDIRATEYFTKAARR